MLLAKQHFTLPLWRDVNTKQLFIIWLCLVTVYRIYLIAQPHVSLFYDEAYYFHWAMQPALGYFSKPPMVAWLIAMTTALFGTSDFAVKLAAPILYGATSWLVVLLTHKLTNERAALMAGMVFSTAPLVSFNSLFITTDAPLLFFWALASLLWVYILTTPRSATLWLALGCACGCGLLSKYTFAFFPIGLIIFCGISSSGRNALNYKTFYAILIAGLLLSMNMFWNWQHDFVSFKHTKDLAKGTGPSFSLIHMLEFLATQALILGLMWAPLIIKKAKVLRLGFKDKTGFIFCLCTLVPILTAMTTQAFLSRAYANWADPFLIPASVFVGIALATTLSSRWLWAGIIPNILLMVVFYHWPTVLSVLHVPSTAHNNPYQRISGWPAEAKKISGFLTAYPETKLASDSRELLAYLGFYNHLPLQRLAYWNARPSEVQNQYDLQANLQYFVGEPGPYLWVSFGNNAELINRAFAHCQMLEPHLALYVNARERPLTLLLCDTFHGYPKN